MTPPVHFEDFAVGQVYDLGSYEISRDEIVEFGRRFDPQPFHVDEQAGDAGVFGGLIASGWHSASIFMRCYVDNLLHSSASMGSPGVEQLRWLVPVRPGDTLSAMATVTDVAPSARRADRGTVFGALRAARPARRGRAQHDRPRPVRPAPLVSVRPSGRPARPGCAICPTTPRRAAS